MTRSAAAETPDTDEGPVPGELELPDRPLSHTIFMQSSTTDPPQFEVRDEDIRG